MSTRADSAKLRNSTGLKPRMLVKTTGYAETTELLSKNEVDPHGSLIVCPIPLH